jgi:hypothetical protein
MISRSYIILFFIAFISFKTRAKQIIHQEVTFSVGMAMVSFAEYEKSFVGDNVEEPFAGSVTALSLEGHYKFKSNLKKAYYMNIVAPLIPSATGNYFRVGGGVEFYLNTMSNNLSLMYSGTQVKFEPRMRYFWGIDGGLAYLSYNTLTSKKNDFMFEIGGTSGLIYKMNDKYTIRASLAANLGMGVIVSGFNLRFFGGLVFPFDLFD